MTEERRLVTILFADVSGSTALGESLDPEDLRALMTRYFAIARDVVGANGGTLEKFIGDAVMAVFGLPIAHGDDAERALDTALELRDRIRADAVLGERLPIRLGVNTGEVVASRDAQAAGDFLITGDAVNVTARLQQGADPWGIVVGERTVRAGGGRFAFGSGESIVARGRLVPVGAALLLGRAKARPARRTRLVGRSDDLDQLDLIARRTLRERRPFLVSIIAPPGTGKSRLLEEFIDRLAATESVMATAVAQCLPYGQRLTYWPMRALLLRLIGLPDDAGPDAVRIETRRWLESLGDTEPGRHSELLAATVGAGELEAIDRPSVFEAWRIAIELAAAQRPLLLVVEDLHWSSDTLLDLVEAILQPRANVPLLMIALTRPELLDRRPDWGGGRRNYVSVALEPLDDRSLEELVSDLLESPASEIVRAVVARADGNPFYAGEIVRSIMERAGRLDDRQAVEAAVATLPETVQATVLARLDLLEPGARRLMQIGSVFGRSFRAAGVRALEAPARDGAATDELGAATDQLSAATDELGAALDGLVDRDLIRPAGADAYTFRHILIREVAYGTLPRAERARLHAGAAAWLESSAGDHADALAELIAYHYREAATLGSILATEPPVALRAAAVAWLRRAADVAMSGAAQLEAARHMEAAIDLAESAQLPELYERLGDIYVGGSEAVAAYAKSLELSRGTNRPPNDQLRVLASQLSVITRWHGSVGFGLDRQVDELAAEGERLLPQATDDRSRATFLIAESYIPFDRQVFGENLATEEALARARAAGREGIEIARRLDDVKLISAGLDGISVGALTADDYRASLAVVAERLALGDRLDFVEQLDARAMTAWHRMALGDLEGCLVAAREGLALISPGQAPSFRLNLTAWQVSALHALGRWDEVPAVYERLEQVWEDMGRPSAGYGSHGFFAAIEVGRGRRDRRLVDRARSSITAIAEQFPTNDRLPMLMAAIEPDMPALEANVVARFRHFAGRIDHLDRPIAICCDRGHALAPETLRALLDHVAPLGIRLVAAQTRRAIGLAERNAAELAEALAGFEAIGAVPYIARVRVELGLLSGDDAMVRSGEAGLEALGDIDQLERVAARRR